MTYEFDDFDKAILRTLQKDASLSMDDLSERVHLSRNACWRRVKQLEQSGVVRGRVALIDARKVGMPLTAFVLIRTDQHDSAWNQNFQKALSGLPEVQSAHRMTGDLDYVLRVRLADIADYDRFYQRLVSKISISDISASFVMDDLIDTTEVPIL
ncbi:Lrp/AsnC family transcriptional regulator [Shimia ponticola]|uniref:Lrp/AsnC family transcriptional regulator n=1 Tax=Shimia ponticola TaxID=2582893 RepID=UPI0011BFB790|nr:Lrp/AsnC family transcriptional regulator [Shimia ponticola]